MKKPTNLKDYKKYVSKKLDALLPVFAEASIGEHTRQIQIPDENDEFTKLYAGVDVMLEVIKKQLAEIRVSESRYRNILDSSLEGIVVEDKQRIMYANKAFAQIYGYNDPEEVIGMHVSAFREPEDNERMSKYTQKRLKGEPAPSSYEFKGVHKDGRILDLEVAVASSLLQEGRGIVAVIRDLTKRKRAEERIQLLSNALESVNDSVSITDLSDKIIYVNEALTKTFGYTKEELIGRNIAILRAGADQQDLSEMIISQTLKGGWAGELWNRRKDGVRFPIWLVTSVVRDRQGKILAMIGVARDITEAKQAESLLRASEERYRIVAETAADAIITIDERGTIKFVNNAAQEIFGYSVDELLGKELTVLMPEHSRPVHKASMKRYIDSGEKHLIWKNIELSGLHKSGKEIPLEISFGESVQEGKRVFTGVVRDITERRKAEVKLRESLAEKELLVKEVHHRVKNNTQIIASLLSMQSKYIKDKEVLRIITDSLNRIKSMAQIHESFYRSESLSRIDFGSQVKQMVVHLFNIYGVDPDVVAFSLNSENIYLDIDTAVPCGLLVNEVVSNSLKHAFPDGRKGKIMVSVNVDEEGKITLIIGDNGVGLPKDYDVKNPDTMGMQVIKTLCSQLGAAVEIDRTGGTKFILELSGKRYKKKPKPQDA